MPVPGDLPERRLWAQITFSRRGWVGRLSGVPQTKATVWLCEGTQHPSDAVRPPLLLVSSGAPGEGIQPRGWRSGLCSIIK